MKVINPQISPRKGAIFRDSVSTYENLLKKARLPTLRNRRLQDCKTVEHQVLMFNAENGLQLVSVPFSFHMEEGQWETQNKRLQRSLFFDQVIFRLAQDP